MLGDDELWPEGAVTLVDKQAEVFGRGTGENGDVRETVAVEVVDLTFDDAGLMTHDGRRGGKGRTGFTAPVER